MNVIDSKRARQRLIVDVLSRQAVHSQTDLVSVLNDHGVSVTASTLSRDLVELEAVRVRHDDGSLVYAVPSEGGDPTPRPAVDTATGQARLTRILRDVLVAADASANLVVLRTPPGAAQYLASAIDHGVDADVLGTIAGDDTVVVITRDPDGGKQVADSFRAWAASPIKEEP